MRLARHAEIVEAMAKAQFERYPAWRDTSMAEMWKWENALGDARQYWLDNATAALDALLEAVVRLGVAERSIDAQPFVSHPALILAMAARIEELEKALEPFAEAYKGRE
jgi:hypothetical protein